MEDPFSALLKALEPVFLLEATRKGEYTYPAIQQLKKATENYKPETKETFTQLLKAITAAMPHIEKWRLHFNSIKKSMDEVAKTHDMTINWTVLLSHPKVSPRFQFSALNHAHKEVDLMTFIATKTKKPFLQLEQSEVTQALVEARDRHGFSKKLIKHLEKYPDFLFHLIMDSEKNFTKICNTKLILYLTDQQIATAIIKHIATFVHKQSEPFDQVEQLVHTLNAILSNGRSISTLLRNSEAKPILYNSIFFQIYQSDSYSSNQEQPPLTEEETLDEKTSKPDFSN